MNVNVLFAVFKRNFVSYFSSPTGYVFICVFVLLSSFAAFWPHEFFIANLANLGQLNEYLPYILLIFIPAITMSIWADERRQGTDELLLTIPANDLDVVLGKYFAAVAIYTTSLLFSLTTNWIMLSVMGDPDPLLLLANYFGYFLVGLAMLAIGMVASFLTSNLTVAFILGALLNAPLVFASAADSIVHNSNLAVRIKQWSIASQFADFGRGVISMSSIVYFLLIVIAMLYLTHVLIGRRHWSSGTHSAELALHYTLRVLALLILAGGLVVLVSEHDARFDMTSNRLNSLSPSTIQLVKDFSEASLKEQQEKLDKAKKTLADIKDPKSKSSDKEVEKQQKEKKQIELEIQRLEQPVRIEAFITPQVPEAFVRKRLELISKLKEFEELAGDKLQVNIYDAEPFSEIAERAEQQYGITPIEVQFERRGSLTQEKIFLGAAFISGLNKVVVKSFDLGVPVEYEIIRSISTVGQTKRKRLGIVATDVDMFGGFDMRSMQMRPEEPFIAELKKHLNVVRVDPNQRIATNGDEAYDVLLVPQPSSLAQPQLDNLVAAVEAGVPTLIFEDPQPVMWNIPGTDSASESQQQMNPFQQRPPQPKGRLSDLWQVLGIHFEREDFFDISQLDESDAKITKDDIPADLVQYYEFIERTQRARGYGPSLGEIVKALNVKRADASTALDRLMAIANAKAREGGGFGEHLRKTTETLVVWQNYTPYPRWRENIYLGPEYVFIREGARGEHAKFNEKDPAVSGMFEVVFPFAGAIVPDTDEEGENRRSKLKYTELVKTGIATGFIRPTHVRETATSPFEMRARETPTDQEYCLTMRIQGPAERRIRSEADVDIKRKPMDVIVVTDIDMLNRAFLMMRNHPSPGERWKFQNIPFVLNLIDELAKDDRFLDIRKRHEEYGELTKFQERVEKISEQMEKVLEKTGEEFREANREAARARREAISQIRKVYDDLRKEGDNVNLGAVRDAQQRLALTTEVEQRREQEKKIRAVQTRDREIEKIRRDRERETHKLEDRYKRLAVFLPPIPPLLLAVGVFFYRRSRETEGVSRERLR